MGRQLWQLSCLLGTVCWRPLRRDSQQLEDSSRHLPVIFLAMGRFGGRCQIAMRVIDSATDRNSNCQSYTIPTFSGNAKCRCVAANYQRWHEDRCFRATRE